jgi:hypothetical protein
MDLIAIKNEINTQLGDKETLNALLVTTFKGLQPQSVKRAIMEGVMRGFTFKDFLEKNIYAIPFRDSYSLVTSIDYARKVGMRSGVVGKSAPSFEMDGKNIVSCTITVKRKVGEHIGEYSATVFFDEYTTGKNLWVSKPRTMLSKVAEVHALRMACPEQMSQMYIEEEGVRGEVDAVVKVEPDDYRPRLEGVQNLEELKQSGHRCRSKRRRSSRN